MSNKVSNKPFGTQYFIRVFWCNQKEMKSETALLADEWGYYSVQTLSGAYSFNSVEKASEELIKIVSEKPSESSDGKIYPPNSIHRICSMSNSNDNVTFRLSVLRVDVDSIIMDERAFVVGSVSFQSPEIKVTAKSDNLYF